MYHRDDRGAPNRQAKPDSNNGDDEGAHVAALALQRYIKEEAHLRFLKHLGDLAIICSCLPLKVMTEK